MIDEDVMDGVWASLPTSKKVKLKLPNSDSDRPAILEWHDAEALRN